MQFDDVPVRNQLLAALEASALANLAPDFDTVRVEPPMTLFGADGMIAQVYFPENAVMSLVNAPGAGGMSGMIAVGREGMAGLSVFLNSYASPLQASVQAPGIVRRMNARTFRRLSAAPGPFRDVMLGYTQTFLAQITQTATCRGAHRLEERCAGWLLVKQERVDASDFTFSSDLLSLELGVRRDGVTLAMRSLQDRQLIRYARDRVEILDADGLGRASCACHVLVRAEFARVLPRVA